LNLTPAPLAPLSADALLTPEAVTADSLAFPGLQIEERRTFGGLLVAQALVGASSTVHQRPAHSLHLLFLTPGAARQQTTVKVERLRDGQRFSARQVQLLQSGKTLASGLVSFHQGDEGPSHQVQMPDAPDPETLEDQRDLRRRNAELRGKPARHFIAEELLDSRPVELPLDRTQGVEGRRFHWFKTRQMLAGGPILHQAMIAFASDMGMVHVGLRVHHQLGDSRAIDAASLDHAIWFHQPARADEWLLQVQRSSVTGNGRGWSRSFIFSRSGILVATVAQEFLARNVK
jgi:acyl-CoA thioesterase-2